MKIPLEPIPTEQIVLAKEKAPARTGMYPQHTQAMMTGAMDMPTVQPPGQMEKAYPWLLGISTCLSALLCWMYVSKPVIVQEVVQQPGGQIAEVEPVADTPKAPGGGSLLPSDTRLPTSKPLVQAPDKQVLASKKPVAIASKDLGPGATDVSGQAPGWEKTNLRVQHILSADDGSGELEKIVLNVPVIYETRNMRWTPVRIENARNILSRLMIYERNLSNLRREGTSILEDWNRLIKETVPGSALRADSPSLPYNHEQQNVTPLQPGSKTMIQVENP